MTSITAITASTAATNTVETVRMRTAHTLAYRAMSDIIAVLIIIAIAVPVLLYVYNALVSHAEAPRVTRVEYKVIDGECVARIEYTGRVDRVEYRLPGVNLTAEPLYPSGYRYYSGSTPVADVVMARNGIYVFVYGECRGMVLLISRYGVRVVQLNAG